MKQARRGPHTLGERWSWVQFLCGFLLAGTLAFLYIEPPLLDGFWVHLVKTITIAGVFGALAGRFGDAAWHGLVRLLRWW